MNGQSTYIRDIVYDNVAEKSCQILAFCQQRSPAIAVRSDCRRSDVIRY